MACGLLSSPLVSWPLRFSTLVSSPRLSSPLGDAMRCCAVDSCPRPGPSALHRRLLIPGRPHLVTYRTSLITDPLPFSLFPVPYTNNHKDKQPQRSGLIFCHLMKLTIKIQDGGCKQVKSLSLFCSPCCTLSVFLSLYLSVYLIPISIFLLHFLLPLYLIRALENPSNHFLGMLPLFLFI